ncbi:MAG: hypothetical protein IKT58_00880 [Oscillospiraceae bacterium]|nr:hypothetical protein [Oscillospiraceae bacterium]
MNKTLSSFFTLILLVVAFTVYMQSPNYALKSTRDDVEEKGIEGLHEHLTQNAKETLDSFSGDSDNMALSAVAGMGESSDFVTEYVNTMKSEMKEIKWELVGVVKEVNSAIATVRFNCNDTLTGIMELDMVREDGEWKIDGLGFPEFDTVRIM